MPHIIGGFPSVKMGRDIEYESLGERLFFYYLELDRDVIRYYPQPVEVPLGHSKGNKGHVPDGLLFRQGSVPILFQVKDKPGTLSEKEELKNEACMRYSSERNWRYEVIYPKTMPHPLPRNLRFLKNFLVRRDYYGELAPVVLYRLRCIEQTSVMALSNMLDDLMNPLAIRPLIYYLVAHGFLNTDIRHEVGPISEVYVNESFTDKNVCSHFGGNMIVY